MIPVALALFLLLINNTLTPDQSRAQPFVVHFFLSPFKTFVLFLWLLAVKDATTTPDELPHYPSSVPHINSLFCKQGIFRL